MPTLEIRFTIYSIAELSREISNHWHTKNRHRALTKQLFFYMRKAQKLGVPYYVSNEALQIGQRDMDVIDSNIVWQYLTTSSVELRLLV